LANTSSALSSIAYLALCHNYRACANEILRPQIIFRAFNRVSSGFHFYADDEQGSYLRRDYFFPYCSCVIGTLSPMSNSRAQCSHFSHAIMSSNTAGLGVCVTVPQCGQMNMVNANF
jgi:hypothetical protein